MTPLSTITRGCLAIVGFIAATAYAATIDWPLTSSVDLSSGFGDYRNRRFHAGVDLRTGGRIGQTVVAPVSGYVMRVRTSYDGYGKVIYLRGDDSRVYVFAHLDSFNDPIDRTVMAAQLASHRYSIDLSLPSDSIRVAQGEFLGKTGQTGSGAPHLHLEVRTLDNVPLNPLLNGFTLNDRTRPTFERLGMVMGDRRSLFPDGSRKIFYAAVPSGRPGHYTIAEKPQFNRPFGILADCYDQMREGGMRQAIYALRLYIDDRPYYEIILDSLHFESGAMSDLEFDNVEAAGDKKRVRRLYQETGNEFRGSRVLVGAQGMVGAGDNLSYGMHRARIVGTDSFGNEAELTFDFVWAPPDGWCHVESTSETGERSIDVTMTPTAALSAVDVDRIEVQVFFENQWVRVDSVHRADLGGGRSRYSIVSPASLPRSVFRFAVRTSDGFRLVDEPFYGLSSFAYTKIALVPSVLEDGLLVTMHSAAPRAGVARLELYYRDSLLGVEYPAGFTSPYRYLFFVPPEDKYARIDRLNASLNEDRRMPAGGQTEVDIRLVGDEGSETVTLDSIAMFRFGREHFYQPRFVQLTMIDTIMVGDLNSDMYELSPEVFLTRKDFEVTFAIRSINQVNDKTGLCWWDPEKKEWVWLTDSRWNAERKTVTASAAGGGRYAALFDLQPPVISRINIKPGMTYYNPRPEIRFTLADNLSGIADDRAIDVRLNGQWLIPEYDPESKICKTRPVDPLPDGEHHVGITVVDRAGNRAEQYFRFIVKDKSRN